VGARFESATDRDRALLRLGLGLLIVLAPLPFGSVRPTAMFVIEVAAGLLGALALWVVARDPATLPPRARLLLVPTGVVLLVGIVQLVPLPAAPARFLTAPTAEARAALADVLPGMAAAPAPLSLSPGDTLDALARFGAYALLGLAAAVAVRKPRELHVLALAIVGSAAFQGLYGAAEYLSGHQHIFAYTKKYFLDSATGTFINRNHFAGYLAIGLPFALVLTLAGLGRRRTGWRARIVSLGEPGGLTTAFAALASIAIWIGVFVSYSRGGLAAALTGFLVLLVGVVGRGRRSVLLLVLALPVLWLSWQQVRAPGERFVSESEHLRHLSGRLPTWTASAPMLRSYAVLGAGYGTYDRLFYLYRPPEKRARPRHAHNDWLQSAIEGGVLVTGAMLWILIGVIRAGPRAGDDPGDEKNRLLRGALTAAAVVVAFHALVDFSLRIPAVAVLAAVVAGAAVGAAAQAAPSSSSSNRVAIRSMSNASSA
jgi:O-antigen ligase